MVAVQLEWLVYGLHKPAGHPRHLLGCRYVELEYGEFVAAKPRDGVGFPHDRQQPAGHRTQQAVADRVTEGIVNILEAI